MGFHLKGPVSSVELVDAFLGQRWRESELHEVTLPLYIQIAQANLLSHIHSSSEFTIHFGIKNKIPFTQKHEE